MNKFANFQNFALSREEMREVSGGLQCDPVAINYGSGPIVSLDGTCYDVYNCRHSFLGIGFGKKKATWIVIPGCMGQKIG